MNPDHLLIKYIEKFDFLFTWLRLFYPKSKGIRSPYLLYFFIPQKLFRINGSIPLPVHFTSRVLNHYRISVGNRSAHGMNANCYIQGRNGIIIGHNLRVGPGVGLISSNHHLNNYDKWPDVPPIVIDNNVWIGMISVVLPGVKIGDNVVVAAGSVVAGDIPPKSIAACNPCQVVKKKEPY